MPLTEFLSLVTDTILNFSYSCKSPLHTVTTERNLRIESEGKNKHKRMYSMRVHVVTVKILWHRCIDTRWVFVGQTQKHIYMDSLDVRWHAFAFSRWGRGSGGERGAERETGTCRALSSYQLIC